ncbi:flavoprotein [Pelosinus sp. sgz500959]|uniref:flavoprotein n=1 Tax=Pelosinus sp. sgz500959 TaxID=3242472 RepID=UPI0036723FF1
MDHEQLVQLVTAEVMRKLGLEPSTAKEESIIPCKKALAIFTGGTIGLEQSFLELQKIQDLHIEVSVVLSAAAEKIIGIDRIKEHLGSNINLVTTHSPYPSKLLRDADFVLVPVLTQNTAAKLAYTLSDTLASTLIMQGLMLGKPILAAMNAADPQDGWRIQKDMGKCSPALSESLRQNLKKIEGYGIELVHVDGLAAGSQKIIDRMAKKASSSQPSEPPRSTRGKKSILDAETIKVAASNGLKSITTPKGSIITPLARDVAREYGIEIVQELS